jgi:hypothetical protein
MKHFILFSRLAVVGILGAVIVNQATAQPPDILRDYRFVTSHSKVLVSDNDSTTSDLRLAIAGRFGLVTGYDYGVDPTSKIPTLVPHAEFVDVKAILFNPLSLAPTPVPGWDLDKTLNLTGLDGTFHVGDPTRLYFHGVDGQGAPINLQAGVHDPLIHIVGANDPLCATCAPDLHGYKIDAVGLLRNRADYNGNGMIDAADYLIWRKTQMTSSMTDDGSQIEIDSQDYLDVWRAEFGQVIGSAGSTLTDTAVPEPATFALAYAAAVFMLVRRARRR